MTSHTKTTTLSGIPSLPRISSSLQGLSDCISTSSGRSTTTIGRLNVGDVQTLISYLFYYEGYEVVSMICCQECTDLFLTLCTFLTLYTRRGGVRKCRCVHRSGMESSE